MKKLIEAFPKPLLQDLIEGHWLPVVGAGLSRNATVPAGKKMPLRDDLGKVRKRHCVRLHTLGDILLGGMR